MDDVIAEWTHGEDLEDCGTVAATAPAADLEAVRDCVVVKSGELRPFRAALVEAAVHDRAYFGEVTVGAYFLTSRGEGITTSTWIVNCNALARSATCTDEALRTTLCVECVSPKPVGSCPLE